MSGTQKLESNLKFGRGWALNRRPNGESRKPEDISWDSQIDIPTRPQMYYNRVAWAFRPSPPPRNITHRGLRLLVRLNCPRNCPLPSISWGLWIPDEVSTQGRLWGPPDAPTIPPITTTARQSPRGAL